MEIVIYSRWKTREGSEAIIDRVDPPTYGSYYQVFGVVNGEPKSWDLKGFIFAGGGILSPHDLMECTYCPASAGKTDSLEFFRSVMFPGWPSNLNQYEERQWNLS